MARTEPLVHRNGHVPAVEGQQRNHVEDADEDVDSDEQQEEFGEPLLLGRLRLPTGNALQARVDKLAHALHGVAV